MYHAQIFISSAVVVVFLFLSRYWLHHILCCWNRSCGFLFLQIRASGLFSIFSLHAHSHSFYSLPPSTLYRPPTINTPLITLPRVTASPMRENCQYDCENQSHLPRVT
uniref:Uncharacterized protein n=1 Tax=Arundo donax TaxID=35708 RepID=A0A0A9QG79_ARUDO